MVYTNAVPQANQQISTTQSPIEANFQFIQAAVNQEHNFPVNATDPTQTYHLQASMPNRADPVALPAGTNGMYYVNGGVPKFFNGTTAYFLPINQAVTVTVSGSVNLTTSPTTVFTVPAFSSGSYFLIPPGGIGAVNASAMGQFVSSNTVLQIGTVSDPGISITASGLSIQAATTSSSLNGSYKFVITYSTP
jgi:hypothetical protein